jgi:hypothetical protein
MSEMVPPRRTMSTAVWTAARRSTPAVLNIAAASGSGRSAVAWWTSFATGEPCASIPTASMTEPGPRPSVRSLTCSPISSEYAWVSTPSIDADRSRRSGSTSIPITRCPRWAATRAAISPIGPRPRIATVSPSAMSAYSTDCQAVGSTSER